MLLLTVFEGNTIQYNIGNKPHDERKIPSINPIPAMIHKPTYPAKKLV